MNATLRRDPAVSLPAEHADMVARADCHTHHEWTDMAARLFWLMSWVEAGEVEKVRVLAQDCHDRARRAREPRATGEAVAS